MAERVEKTPSAPRPSLKTGIFHEKLGYAVTRPRGANDWLVIYTLCGRGLFTHRAGQSVASPHDVALIQPGTTHRYEVEPDAKRWDLVWAHFTPPAPWIPWLNWPTLGEGFHWLSIRDPAIRRRAVRSFKLAHHIATGYSPHRHELAMNALEAALLHCDEQNPQADRRQLDPRIAHAMDHLCRNLNQPMTLEALAKVSHLSPSRFSHLFRDEVGQTPHQFLEQQRLYRAKQLLELSGLNIAQIAAEVGYRNAFYFTLRFKRATELSPRQYRRQFASA
jgi:AraC family transcriptional regulator of arabinose operon